MDSITRVDRQNPRGALEFRAVARTAEGSSPRNESIPTGVHKIGGKLADKTRTGVWNLPIGSHAGGLKGVWIVVAILLGLWPSAL
jgi:hypothetical protein